MSLIQSRRRDAARLGEGPVLVIVGMKREAACAAGDGVRTICSGANVARLRAELKQLEDAKFSAVLSFGLAGALDYELRPGDVLVSEAVVAGAARHTTHSRLTDALREGVAAKGAKAVAGVIVGVDRPAMDPAAKKALRESTKAVAVDMESHVAAEFALSRRLPFAVVRAISDPAARALPPLAAKALTPDGDIDGKIVARELIRAPGQIGGLILAGLDSRAAFGALGRCGPLLGPLSRLVLANL